MKKRKTKTNYSDYCFEMYILDVFSTGLCEYEKQSFQHYRSTIHFCYEHCNPLYLAPVLARHKFARSSLEMHSTSIAFNWRSYSRPVCLNGVGGRKPFLHRAFTFLSPPQQKEP